MTLCHILPERGAVNMIRSSIGKQRMKPLQESLITFYMFLTLSLKKKRFLQRNMFNSNEESFRNLDILFLVKILILRYNAMPLFYVTKWKNNLISLVQLIINNDGARGEMDPSSNPGRSCLLFTYSLERYASNYSPSSDG